MGRPLQKPNYVLFIDTVNVLLFTVGIWLFQLKRKLAQVTRIFVLAHSLGGLVALRTGLANQGLFHKIVLAAPMLQPKT